MDNCLLCRRLVDLNQEEKWINCDECHQKLHYSHFGLLKITSQCPRCRHVDRLKVLYDDGEGPQQLFALSANQPKKNIETLYQSDQPIAYSGTSFQSIDYTAPFQVSSPIFIEYWQTTVKFFGLVSLSTLFLVLLGGGLYFVALYPAWLFFYVINPLISIRFGFKAFTYVIKKHDSFTNSVLFGQAIYAFLIYAVGFMIVSFVVGMLVLKILVTIVIGLMNLFN